MCHKAGRLADSPQAQRARLVESLHVIDAELREGQSVAVAESGIAQERD